MAGSDRTTRIASMARRRWSLRQRWVAFPGARVGGPRLGAVRDHGCGSHGGGQRLTFISASSVHSVGVHPVTRVERSSGGVWRRRRISGLLLDAARLTHQRHHSLARGPRQDHFSLVRIISTRCGRAVSPSPVVPAGTRHSTWARNAARVSGGLIGEAQDASPFRFQPGLSPP